MMISSDERLNQIMPRVTSRDFLDSKELCNKIGFWIFAYFAEREIEDMDDGVKVSYGKFGNLLADVKPITRGSKR